MYGLWKSITLKVDNCWYVRNLSDHCFLNRLGGVSLEHLCKTAVPRFLKSLFI